MSSLTKNDKAWDALFNRYEIVKTIKNEGKFLITSTAINEFREARLMTKFDHSNNRPDLFKENNFSILPVTRGSYIIAEFDAYKSFEKDHTLPIEHLRFPEHFQSIDFENITSEATAINCAYVSGIFSDFLDEEELTPTVSGRMSSKSFDFSISGPNSSIQMNINNSQVEIDGGYEGLHSLSLIEAKNALSSDFLVRQLYYPYRLWESKVSKTVRPIFLIYTNGIFHLYEYRFEDTNNYNSLSLIKQKRYSLEEQTVSFADIQVILASCATESEPEVPFPQADSFERVINLCELLSERENLSRDDITTQYDFDKRQTNYYTDAGRYLGLIDKKNDGGVKYFLTSQGKVLFEETLRQRQLKLIESILKHAVFSKTLELYFKKLEPPTRYEIVEIMRQSELYNVGRESSTIERRASTVLGWINWILTLPDA